MKRIKLDAIDSTNDFLKLLANQGTTENFTVVTAQHQVRGKGQMGAKWYSEKGKNLIMSLLLKEGLPKMDAVYTLNSIVALCIIEVLEGYNIPKLAIKWPNDIMSDHKKIGGILIENSFKNASIAFSVIGIGLNVNQRHFDGLPQASSLAVVMDKEFDIEQLLVAIVNRIKQFTSEEMATPVAELWSLYNDKIFRKSVPTTFENLQGERFMGIIKEVDTAGRLQLLLENDRIASYEIKEIKMLY